MERPIIVIKLKEKQFGGIAELAQHVYDKMNGNSRFPSPHPTLAAFQAAIADLNSAISKWGPVGSRGSHTDYVNLQGKATYMRLMLKQMADYCITQLDSAATREEQAIFLLTSGFVIRSAKTPQGALQAVQNLRRVISLRHNYEKVRLRWKKPQNITSVGNVKCYTVYRSAVNNFDTAQLITSVSSTAYTDKPGAGTWYYWVAAHNYMGSGVMSEAVSAYAV